MKTTRYQFEKTIQEASEASKEWLIDAFKSILESDKDFTRKADYIGFSIANIDAKVASLDEEIKELQELKKKLKAAKEMTLKVGADVFSEYGIEKLEGAGISSITLTPQKIKQTEELEILDERSLLKLGYCYIKLDEEMIKDELKTFEGRLMLIDSARMVTKEVTSDAKLKVNKRRGSKESDETLELAS